MARRGKGILDGFTGKVGTVIGGSWRGVDYIRSKPIPKKNPTFSLKQKTQQAKFGLGIKFINALTGLFEFTYREESGKTARNSALSNTLSEAIGGVYPNLQIDYSQVKVSSGTLRMPQSAAAVSAAPGSINFSWDDNSMLINAAPEDKAILVVYCEELADAVYTTSGAPRSQLADALVIPYYSGKRVHTWVAFRTADGMRTSQSVYAGSFIVM